MFRIWGKIIKDTRFVKDYVVAIEDSDLSKDQKIHEAIKQFCEYFDLERPHWFDKNTKELIMFSKTSFHDDQFIESIDFDYFEIEIIEEDKKI
ncbi:hypothetical protein QBE53_00540 [Vallitaleaceae bacterium 9-2]